MNVLVLCSGNICRSPMVAAQLRQRISVERHSGWFVDSAGTLGIDGSPASPEALEVMREVGLDLSAHRSQGLRIEHVEWADLVIGMTHAHMMELASRFPRNTTDRLVLRAFEEGHEPYADAPDLPDPIGRPLRFYRNQVPIIVRCVDHLIQHLARRQS